MAAVGVALAIACAGCSGSKDPPRKTVVVYTCLDKIHSEPILAEFERRTGIKVLPQYDAESAKTTGLVTRLLARRDRPDCDVLWNNEIIQTERLAQQGLLAKYVSPQAERFGAKFRDPEGRWTGFAGRMRVIIYNKDLVGRDDVPTGLADLADPKWRGRATIARPLFGTTLTHMIVLHQKWGPEALSDYLRRIRANEVALAPGNGPVRDLVAAGEWALGLTDTDDAYAAMLDGKPVGVAIPDRSQGAVLIPNTVALVANCPHPTEGKQLIDYLLSAEVERRLAKGRSAQIPLATDLQDVKTPWDELLADTKFMDVDVAQAAGSVTDVLQLLTRAGMAE